MESSCMKENMNVYFRARKQAAMYNDKLYSREGASELLGVSVSTLADYELGNTKVVPVDKVVLMADLYHCPELKTGITLRLVQQFDSEELNSMKKSLINIAADGIISEDERPELDLILKKLDDMALAISEMKLTAEKMKGER